VNASHQTFYAQEVLPDRPVRLWPGKKPLAVVFLVSIETYELCPPASALQPVGMPGGFGKGPFPDVRSYSVREYGNRIGVFRLLDALRRFRIKATVAIDSQTVWRCPEIVARVRADGLEVAAHGVAVSRVISTRMSEGEERRYISEAKASIATAFGTQPAGWHGPEYGESTRTPTLLAEHGFRYVLDWPNDEQPLFMTTSEGPLLGVPVAVDLDDVFCIFHRRIPIARWVQAVRDTVDRLTIDGRAGARVLVLNLHPWLIGHGFRISYLEELLAGIVRRKDVRIATAGDVASWW
jgi:allantoinase